MNVCAIALYRNDRGAIRRNRDPFRYAPDVWLVFPIGGDIQHLRLNSDRIRIPVCHREGDNVTGCISSASGSHDQIITVLAECRHACETHGNQDKNTNERIRRFHNSVFVGRCCPAAFIEIAFLKFQVVRHWIVTYCPDRIRIRVSRPHNFR